MKVKTIFQTEGKPEQRKNQKAGAQFKRFVSMVAAEMKKVKYTDGCKPFQKRKSANSKSEEEGEVSTAICQSVPEILRVSPMHTSCEVALVSSSIDREDHNQDSVITRTEKNVERDGSYHVILNLHRSACKEFRFRNKDYDDEQNEIGSHDVTQDLTENDVSRDISVRSASYGSEEYINGNFKPNSFVSRIDEHCASTGNYLGYIKNVSDEHDYNRARHDFMSYRNSTSYDSLFNPSDSEHDDDDQGEFDFNLQSQTMNHRPRTLVQKNVKSKAVRNNEVNAGLNTTLDTVLENDEDSSRSLEDGIPSEILVRVISV